MNKFTQFVSDSVALSNRNLKHYTRLPQLIVFSSIQPLMFMLLFVYVFGGAIRTGFDNYLQFLLPGIIVQTMVFGSMMTGVGLAADLALGVIDRFRSMPISRTAVLLARTLTDVIRNLIVVAIMVITGFIIGFRVEHGWFNFSLAILIALAFSYAFSWISATVGLAVKNVETAQSAGFIWVFPLVFASSIFVPVDSMPAWLQTFAKNTPVTITVNAVRGLISGLPTGNAIWHSLFWSLGIVAIFAPLAGWMFSKRQ